jgi:hypothetical protein
LTTHKERREIYRLLSEETGGLPPNQAINAVDEVVFKEIIKKAKQIIKQREATNKTRRF